MFHGLKSWDWKLVCLLQNTWRWETLSKTNASGSVLRCLPWHFYIFWICLDIFSCFWNSNVLHHVHVRWNLFQVNWSKSTCSNSNSQEFLWMLSYYLCLKARVCSLKHYNRWTTRRYNNISQSISNFIDGNTKLYWSGNKSMN
jgi:hypothetical protein